MTPATSEQLRTLNRIVYGILNRRNGRWYIGQTVRTFQKRYRGNKWWTHTTNEPLRRAYYRHGPKVFEIYILASNIKTNTKMDLLEKQMIVTYNSIFPRGYNFEDGGQRYGKRVNAASRAKMSAFQRTLKAKDYVLIGPDGMIHKFSNVCVFADKYGLDSQTLANLLRGQGATRYKGYHLPNIHPDKWSQSDTIKTVVDPAGNEHSFYNTAKFARQHGLDRSCLCDVVIGQAQSHRGWQRKSDNLKSVGYRWRSENNSHKKYERIILERDGEQYSITNDIQVFCQQHGIHKRDIYALTGGDQKTAHGFRLVSVEYTSTYLAKHPELNSLS